MTENATDTVWLTREAYDKLSDELEYLKGDGRTEVSEKIAGAREEGDLSENGGYHAAREEQGQMEARIVQLEDILRRAEVGEAPATGEAGPGSQVTVAYFGDEDDTDTFLVGSREVLGLDDSVDIQVFSPQSPLGAAVIGKKQGETTTYTAPTGKDIEITVLKVATFQG
ncbi:transcription elongation factor GreA [Luteococcus sediminum]|uniref:transcription elongation factor GreA n=1 Tax=Luteococcus sp. TaxID=1969402 RepID=UPI00373650EB